MSKRKFLIPLATLSLLFSTLVACNNGGGSESKPGKSSDAGQSSQNDNSSQNQGSSQQGTSSQQGGSSSQQGGSSSQQGTSSQQQSHEHEYELVGTAAKNADGKDVSLYECKNHDDKYIAMAFGDFASKNEDFDSAAKASKYGEVAASIWDDAVMFAKTKTFAISWKFNVDKAISGAKLEFGLTSTYASHGNTSFADKYLVKVNDGAFASWEATGTYTENGLAPTKRTYVTFKTIDLAAGENTITIQQNNTENRLLFGGEMRVHYNSDAKPVTPEVPFEGYNVTFTTEHCKVLVYEGKKYDQTPVETNTTKAMDEDGNIVPYDIEDELPQPQVNFKVVPDEGYSVTAPDNFTITGTYKNLKQNPAKSETPAVDDDSIFRITKIQGDLTVAIVAVEGQSAPGKAATFAPEHCSVKVYVGPKSVADRVEDAGPIFYGRDKNAPYDVVKTGGQINFVVTCDEGYEFVPEIAADETVSFIQGTYKAFKDDGDGCYRVTNIQSDLVITLAATKAPIAQPVGSYHGQVKLIAAMGGAYQPVDMELAADSVEITINGETVAVASYEWDGANRSISIVTDGVYGTLTASYDQTLNAFTVTGVSGQAGQALDPEVTAILYGHGTFYNCTGTTEELQNLFQRRFWRPGQESSWQKDNSNADRVSADETNRIGNSGNGVKLRPCGGQNTSTGEKYRVSISLKNDFAEAKAVTALSFWVFNPSENDITLRAWGYQAAGYSSNYEFQANTTLTAKAGSWTYMNLSFWKNNAPQKMNMLNFQVADFTGSGVAFTFDNFCLL